VWVLRALCRATQPDPADRHEIPNRYRLWILQEFEHNSNTQERKCMEEIVKLFKELLFYSHMAAAIFKVTPITLFFFLSFFLLFFSSYCLFIFLCFWFHFFTYICFVSFMCFFISYYYCLISLFVDFFFRIFPPFIYLSAFPVCLFTVFVHFSSLLRSFIVFLAFYIFFLLLLFNSLSVLFLSSIYFSSLVVNTLAAVYFHHFISKIRSETFLLNRCSFHVCQFEFA
jgi:hypothetical protein